jgi:hypothetical protein
MRAPVTAPPIAEKLLRFSLEQITDTGIVSRTSASELWQVTEVGAAHRHLVRVETDGRTACAEHGPACMAATAVNAERLRALLEPDTTGGTD